MINVIAARALGVTAFGGWALAWIVVYGIGAFHAAMLQTPLQVLTQRPGGGLDKSFVRALLRLQGGAVVMAGVLASVAAAVLGLSGSGLMVLAAVGVLTTGFTLVEFNRRAVLVLGLFRTGSMLEIARGTIAVGALALFVLLKSHTASLGVLLVLISGVYLAVGGAGHLLIYRRLAVIAPAAIGKTVRRCWIHSRWLVLLALSQRLGPDLITVMVGARVGQREIGGLRSMIQILNIFNVAFQTMQVTLPIKAVQLHREQGNEAVLRLVIRSIATATALFAVVATLLWLFGPVIVRLLLGSAYVPFAWILPWLSLSYLAMFVGFPFACWAHALGASRYLLIANLIAAAASQTVMAICFQTSPLRAAVAAIVTFSAVEACTLALMVTHRTRRDTLPSADQTPATAS